MRRLIALSCLLASPALAGTLEVGPGKPYGAPCAAIAASHDGDTIEIDAAGSYDGDVCVISHSGLTLRGVGGGRAHIDAAGKNAQGKAIWVIAGDDTTVENVEFSGASVVDKNGAGIRQEGKNLTVRNCFFHDNEDGILAGDNPGSLILIEFSEFKDNGAGDGYSHNMYINHVKQFTLQSCWSHGAREGHLVKSRALESDILYNRLTDEAGATASYELDLPNGGTANVMGNLIEQGASSHNGTIVEYGGEGPQAGSQLFFVNNTVVNDRTAGGTFLGIAAAVDTPAVVRNNVFAGPGTVSTQASAVLEGNYTGSSPGLVDAASFDYHLLPGSPCVDAGVDPGSLLPVLQYLHPAGAEVRPVSGPIDIGAYELAGAAGSGGNGGEGGSGDSEGSGGGASHGPRRIERDAVGCDCRSARGGVWEAALGLGLLAVRRRI